jgi:CRP/FNR family cyclic AMP-dependent transcriptional regulator
MQLDEIVGLLHGAPLFEGLSNEELSWISLSGEPIIFTNGRTVISNDQPGDAGYLILSGTLLRVSGPGIQDEPQQLGRGTFIGEMAMLIEHDHSSTIVSYGNTRALKFTRSLMQRLMTDHPKLAEHFSDKIRAKFLKFADQLRSIEQSLETNTGNSLSDSNSEIANQSAD